MTLFKDSAGICKEDKNTYIVMALINLITSIILCKKIGISGVIIGTAISYIYLILYSYPKYVFKPLFNKESKFYYEENLKYVIFIFVSAILSFLIGYKLQFTNLIVAILFKGLFSVGITCLIFTLFFYRSNEFKYFKDIFLKMLKK